MEDNSLEYIFNNELQEPFSYNITLEEDENNIPNLFNKIKDIYILGLSILFGNGDEITLNNLDDEKIKKINKYMLSLGIEVKYVVYTPQKKSDLIEKFLKNIEKNEDLSVKCIIDWETQYIENIKLIIKNDNNKILENIKKLVYDKYIDLNYMLEIFPPVKLSDISIIINKFNNQYIISFDLADKSKYLTYKNCRIYE